jgi:ribosomal protein S12
LTKKKKKKKKKEREKGRKKKEKTFRPSGLPFCHHFKGVVNLKHTNEAKRGFGGLRESTELRLLVLTPSDQRRCEIADNERLSK